MNRVCAIHTRFLLFPNQQTYWNTILQSLQAKQYVGFINLPADLNDWLPESIHIQKSKYICIIRSHERKRHFQSTFQRAPPANPAVAENAGAAFRRRTPFHRRRNGRGGRCVRECHRGKNGADAIRCLHLSDRVERRGADSHRARRKMDVLLLPA